MELPFFISFSFPFHFLFISSFSSSFSSSFFCLSPLSFQFSSPFLLFPSRQPLLPFPLSKYARNRENMHTSRQKDQRTASSTLEVCTKTGKHAHFETKRLENCPQHPRSMHQNRKTCTLRERKKEETYASNELMVIFASIIHKA